MSKCLKKLFAITIALAILIACIPTVSVFAETLGGTCGENVTWSLDADTGVLTISGSGDMDDYYYGYFAPWYSQRASIKSVSIENGVTSIGDYAFRGCSILTSVTIGNSVTSIGSDAFHKCSSLTSITIPDSVTSIGYRAFAYCIILTSVTIPDSVTRIGNDAFSYCSSLTSITIPDSVTRIGSGAFSGCSILTSVTIGNSVTSIGDYAFYDCSSLTSVTIPDSVTSIGSDAFHKCSSLTSITIPDSVTSIGISAFKNCSSLESMTLPFVGGSATENQYLGYIFGASDCFDNSSYVPSSLKTVIILDKCTSIDNYAFYDCINLTSVTIPDSVTSIGYNAFYHCSSLTSITIPDSVTSIGGSAFWGCFRLTSVNIQNGVTSIGGGAFEFCSSLKSVTIPDSVTSIGKDAFDCYNLKIYGYMGTAAETYALKYGIKFIPITDLVDSENNISVSGAVSAGTELKVDKVTITDTRVTYDITLTQNGEEIQPEGSVTVKIPLPTGINSVECKVYREEENGSYTNMNAVYKDGFMVFITEHFSKYVLTSENLGVIIGDANGDGRINNKDLGLLMQKLNGWAVEIDDAVADVNADGKVNNKDYGLLMQYVNGWNVEIG